MTPAVFGHGHLRLYLLNLLAERPRHGYELIQALGERFGGTYTPSAGTIYPRLAKLEEDGLVAKASDGRKTVYTITEAGRAELDARRSELDGIEDGVTDSVRRLADEVRSSVAAAMTTLRADLAAVARESPAPPTAASDTEAAPGSARIALHTAEAALAHFRTDARAALRARALRGELTSERLQRLNAALEAAREALR